MQRKIELILKAENLTSSQLADRIGVQRSALSHILSGRNDPSLSMIKKILTEFPQISADWLLLDKGTMYDKKTGFYSSELLKPDSEGPFSSPSPKQGELFPFFPDETPSVSHSDDFIAEDYPLSEERAVDTDEIVVNAGEMNGKDRVEEPLVRTRKTKGDSCPREDEIEKIVFFYKDGHCRIYHP